MINVFGQNMEKKFDKTELLSAIRRDIAGELFAINEYLNHASLTDNVAIKTLWKDIATEEMTHVGELTYILHELSSEDLKYFQIGMNEAKEKLKNLL